MDAKLAFLAEIFPNKSISLLLEVIKSNPNCDNNTLVTIVMTQPSGLEKREKRKKLSKRDQRREFLANLHDKRISKLSSNPPTSSGSISSNKHFSTQRNKRSIQNDLQAIRGKHRSKWSRNRFNDGRKPRMMTLSDLSRRKKEKEDYFEHNPQENRSINTISNLLFDPKRMGQDSLKYTNDFRKRNGLNELKWSEKLHKIALVHSKNMGDGKCPFGHRGFNGRVKDMQRATGCRNAAENVAYTSETGNMAKQTVDGWIGSPGHRKNMLSNQTICAIAVYKNSSGLWFVKNVFTINV